MGSKGNSLRVLCVSLASLRQQVWKMCPMWIYLCLWACTLLSNRVNQSRNACSLLYNWRKKSLALDVIPTIDKASLSSIIRLSHMMHQERSILILYCGVSENINPSFIYLQRLYWRSLWKLLDGSFEFVWPCVGFQNSSNRISFCFLCNALNQTNSMAMMMTAVSDLLLAAIKMRWYKFEQM